MTGPKATSSGTQHAEHSLSEDALDLGKESITMALYIAVSVFAGLTAVREHGDTAEVVVLSYLWGTTVALALAHWFAFRVSARLVGGGRIGVDDLRVSGAQLLGAVVVALYVTVPVLLFPTTAQLDIARLALAGLIAIVGFLVARTAGAGPVRSAIGAGCTLVIAVVVAVVKNVLSGH